MNDELFDVYVFRPGSDEVVAIEQSVEKDALIFLLDDLAYDGYGYKVVDQFDGVIVIDRA